MEEKALDRKEAPGGTGLKATGRFLFCRFCPLVPLPYVCYNLKKVLPEHA
jgi:hypothetical protein